MKNRRDPIAWRRLIIVKPLRGLHGQAVCRDSERRGNLVRKGREEAFELKE